MNIPWSPEQSSELLQKLPYPLSHLLQNFLKSCRTEEEIVPPFVTLEAISGLSKFLAFIAIADYIHAKNWNLQEVGKHNRYLLNSLEKPSDGTWSAVLEYLSKLIPAQRATSVLFDLIQTKPQNTSEKTLLEIIKSYVKLRNQLVHPTAKSMSSSEIAKQLQDYLFALTPLWQEISQCQFVSFGRRCQGFPPFDKLNDLQEVIIETPQGDSIPLSPLVYADFNSTIPVIYFYNKRIQLNYSFMSYIPGEHNSAEMISPQLLELCNSTFQQLEQNALPKQTEVRPDILEFHHLGTFHQANFVGREEVIQKISDFITQASGEYGIITGEAGIGKTALMAMWYLENHKQPLSQHHIWHFCAHTDERDNPQVFLRSILAQGYTLFPQEKQAIPYEIHRLRLQWQQFLKKVSSTLDENTKLVFVIDALDEALQGEDEKQSIPHILPAELPKNIVGILTARSDLLGRLSLPRFSKLTFLCDMQKLQQQDVKTLLVERLGFSDSQISTAIIDKIWQSSQHGDPFYLRFLADALRNNLISLSNLESAPLGLDDFFDQTWLSLPDDDDFLVYRILGLLSVMATPGNDTLFSEVLKKAENIIGKARFLISKLVVSQKEDYTLFHERFKSYVQNKFRGQELAEFHRALVKYYDNQTPEFSRNHQFLSEDALRYMPYHAYCAGKYDHDYNALYDLLKDQEFQKTKHQILRARKFVLDDWRYGVIAAVSEASQDHSKLLRCFEYATNYNSMLVSEREQLPSLLHQRIKAKEYTLAASEISLLPDEESQFYQFLLLSCQAIIDGDIEKAEDIVYQAMQVSIPKINNHNFSIFFVCASEFYRNGLEIPNIFPPHMEWQFARELLQIPQSPWSSGTKKSWMMQQYAQNDQETYELLCEYGKISEDCSLLSEIHNNIQSPVFWVQSFFELHKIYNNTQSGALWSQVATTTLDLEETQDKMAFIEKFIQKVPLDLPNISEIIDLLKVTIEKISDDATRFYLTSELLLRFPENLLKQHLADFHKWLEEASSITKKAKLQPVLTAYQTTAQNLEENWLALDNTIKDLGTKTDPKEIRQLVDFSRAVRVFPDRDIAHDLVRQLVQQSYLIGNEKLRLEVISQMAFQLAHTEFTEITAELYEQVFYAVDRVFPWENRGQWLWKITKDMQNIPQTLLRFAPIILKGVFAFPEGPSCASAFQKVISLLPKEPSIADNILKKLQQSPAFVHSAIVRSFVQWWKNTDLERLLQLLQIVENSSHMVQKQSLSQIAWAVYLCREHLQALSILYHSQEKSMASNNSQIYFPQSLDAIAQRWPHYRSHIIASIQNDISSETRWEPLLYLSRILQLDNSEQSQHYFAQALQQIDEIPNKIEKYSALLKWSETLKGLTELSSYQKVLEDFRAIALSFDDYTKRSNLLVTCADCLRTLKDKKQARRWFHELQEIAEQNFSDPVYLYRTVGQIAFRMGYQKEFSEEATPYVEKIWEKAEESTEPIVLAGLLRILRPFGQTKRIKQMMENVYKSVDAVADLTRKGLVLKDMLWTLNGISETSRLQKLLGKLFGVIANNDVAKEQSRRLIEIVENLSRLEEFGNISEVWEYLTRIHKIANDIQDPLYSLQAHSMVAKYLYSNSMSEKAHSFYNSSQEKLSQLQSSKEKSQALGYLTHAAYAAGNYEEALEFIKSVPLWNEKMKIVRNSLEKSSLRWKLQLLPLALEDTKSLDATLSHLLVDISDDDSEKVWKCFH